MDVKLVAEVVESLEHHELHCLVELRSRALRLVPGSIHQIRQECIASGVEAILTTLVCDVDHINLLERVDKLLHEVP